MLITRQGCRPIEFARADWNFFISCVVDETDGGDGGEQTGCSHQRQGSEN